MADKIFGVPFGKIAGAVRCARCGHLLTDDDSAVEHKLVPECLGGNDSPLNRIMLCKDCELISDFTINIAETYQYLPTIDVKHRMEYIEDCLRSLIPQKCDMCGKEVADVTTLSINGHMLTVCEDCRSKVFGVFSKELGERLAQPDLFEIGLSAMDFRIDSQESDAELDWGEPVEEGDDSELDPDDEFGWGSTSEEEDDSDSYSLDDGDDESGDFSELGSDEGDDSDSELSEDEEAKLRKDAVAAALATRDRLSQLQKENFG